MRQREGRWLADTCPAAATAVDEPAIACRRTFTMQVTDGAGNKASKQFNVTILPTWPPPPPPPGHHHGQQ